MTHIGEIAVPRSLSHGHTAATLPDLLAQQAAARGAAVALLHKRHGIWQRQTWHEVADTAARWAAALADLGVARGDNVVIAGANRPRLLIAMLACQIRGAVPVLVPQAGAGAGLAQVLRAHPAKLIFAAGEHEVHAIHAIRADLAMQPNVICDDLRGLRSLWDNWLTDWDAWDRAAEAVRDSGDVPESATAAIVFAPGDTEARQPITLTHRAVASAALSVVDGYRVTPKDRTVLAVPFGWPSALVLGTAQALASGGSLAIAESDATVLADLREAGPTLLFGPPLLFRQIRQAGFRHVCGTATPWRDVIGHALGFTGSAAVPPGMLGRVLLAMLRKRLGLSRLRLAISTEAAAAPQVTAFFESLGVNMQVFADPQGPAAPAAVAQEARLTGSVFIRAAYATATAGGIGVALIAPDAAAITLWARQRGEALRSTEDIAALPSVIALLAAEIATAEPAIGRFLIAAQGLSPQAGDIAPDGTVQHTATERLHAAALARLRSGGGIAVEARPQAQAAEPAAQATIWAMQAGIGVL
jgi:long-subunit acyl-CoA synthetase (AMP-forming)